MKIKMQKYAIMTADKKKIEVGQARNYSFMSLKDFASSGTKINLFCSESKAKSSFERSWFGRWEWDKDYIVVPITITYDINI